MLAGNFYDHLFKSSAEAAEKLGSSRVEAVTDIAKLHEPFFTSSMPTYLQDILINSLSHIRCVGGMCVCVCLFVHMGVCGCIKSQGCVCMCVCMVCVWVGVVLCVCGCVFAPFAPPPLSHLWIRYFYFYLHHTSSYCLHLLASFGERVFCFFCS